jgi:hypothetical protein
MARAMGYSLSPYGLIGCNQAVQIFIIHTGGPAPLHCAYTEMNVNWVRLTLIRNLQRCQR